MTRAFNNYSKNFSLEKSFKEWLQTMLKSRATSDYPSRMRRFFREEYHKLSIGFSFNGDEIYSLFGALMAQGADGRNLVFAFLDLCIGHAYKEKTNSSQKTDRDKFNNYLSALFSFQKFLLDLTTVLEALASIKKGGNTTGKTKTTSTDSGIDIYGVNIPDVIMDLAATIGQFKKKDLNAQVCKNALGKIYGQLKNTQLTVSAQVMRKKFRNQFNTERRVAGKGLLYPINIIVTIINKKGTKGAVSNFWDKVINDIKVIISENGEWIPFKEIISLSIEYEDNGMGRLKAKLRNKKKTSGGEKGVYTEIYSDDDTKRYMPFLIKSTSQINRDHDKPIAQVLTELNNDDFPCLTKMTEAYRKSQSKKSQDVQDQLATLLGGSITSNYADELYEEIKKLFGYLSFTLMEEHENKKKSNK